MCSSADRERPRRTCRRRHFEGPQIICKAAIDVRPFMKMQKNLVGAAEFSHDLSRPVAGSPAVRSSHRPAVCGCPLIGYGQSLARNQSRSI